MWSEKGGNGEDVIMLTVGSLFSGVGGLELGLERTGKFKTIWQCEIEPYASAVLKKHWPEVPNLGDITKVDWNGVQRPDVICGGMPCQPVSIAGKKLGKKDKRWMWDYYANAIDSLKPRFVLFENVPHIARIDGGGLIKEIEASLNRMGYDTEWKIISIKEFGGPTQRKRLFLIAFPSGLIGNNRIFANLKNEIHGNEKWSATQNLKSGSEWKRWLNEACKTLDGEISQSDFFGVDDGAPKELDRIKTIGNSASPIIAECLGRIILSLDNCKDM